MTDLVVRTVPGDQLAPNDQGGQAVKPRRLVTCQYDAKPHLIDDECVNVEDAEGHRD